jgi:hypothetical protein
MTLDEKCDQLRERIEMLVVEIANEQRKLHDRSNRRTRRGLSDAVAVASSVY